MDCEPGVESATEATAGTTATGWPKGSAASLKFNRSDRFIRELRKRVDAYFEHTGRSRRDCAAMYFKTASIMAWFLAAYLLLLFFVTSWWLVLPLAVVLGIS